MVHGKSKIKKPFINLFGDDVPFQLKFFEFREHWLEERTKGIGGSDASVILGENPYKTSKDLWEEKKGIKEAEDISHKEHVQYGTKAEEHLRNLFALDFPQYSVWHVENHTLESKEYPFMRYSADGLLLDCETGEKGILEVKTTNILASSHKEKWNNKIPQNYYIQVLHGLIVTGYDFVILKAQLRYQFKGELPKFETKHYLIRREDVLEDIEFLKQAEIEWWNRYMIGNETPKINLAF